MLCFDHAAATAIEPAALAAMTDAAGHAWGNPDSLHALGRRSRAVLDDAADRIGAWMAREPASLRWFGSASAALRAALELALARTSGPVVTTAIEHAAVDDVLVAAELAGREVVRLAVPSGRLIHDDAIAALRRAELVVIAPLHHELGCAVDVAALVPAAPQAWWIVDAVQSSVWSGPLHELPLRSFVGWSSAKLGGPPGLGVLSVPTELAHLRGRDDRLRSAGGLPWLSAVGLAAACEQRSGTAMVVRRAQRERATRLLAGLLAADTAVVHNGAAGWRGPILDVSVRGRRAIELESALDMHGVAVARTSTCRLELDEGSRAVARAHPDEPWRAESALRWSLGWYTTDDEVDAAIAAFTEVCRVAW